MKWQTDNYFVQPLNECQGEVGKKPLFDGGKKNFIMQKGKKSWLHRKRGKKPI